MHVNLEMFKSAFFLELRLSWWPKSAVSVSGELPWSITRHDAGLASGVGEGQGFRMLGQKPLVRQFRHRRQVARREPPHRAEGVVGAARDADRGRGQYLHIGMTQIAAVLFVVPILSAISGLSRGALDLPNSGCPAEGGLPRPCRGRGPRDRMSWCAQCTCERPCRPIAAARARRRAGGCRAAAGP